jgi:hypothetical protein
LRLASAGTRKRTARNSPFPLLSPTEKKKEKIREQKEPGAELLGVEINILA